MDIIIFILDTVNLEIFANVKFRENKVLVKW